MKVKLIVTLFFSLLASQSFAAADIKAGEAKSQACFACHGPKGVSANPAWPKLAGQHAQYIAKQLADFKKGTRKEALMASQVANLSKQDMENIGAYFAAQTTSTGSADKKKVDLGGKIYRGGNKTSGVAACQACHGPTGSGNPLAKFPALSGQHAAYTTKALKDFRSKARSNDAGSMMRDIAKRMTDAEIDAVASYIQGLK